MGPGVQTFSAEYHDEIRWMNHFCSMQVTLDEGIKLENWSFFYQSPTLSYQENKDNEI